MRAAYAGSVGAGAGEAAGLDVNLSAKRRKKLGILSGYHMVTGSAPLVVHYSNILVRHILTRGVRNYCSFSFVISGLASGCGVDPQPLVFPSTLPLVLPLYVGGVLQVIA